MVWIFNILLFFLFFDVSWCSEQSSNKKQYHVRVLLFESDIDSFGQITIENENGFLLINKKDKTKSTITQSKLTIRYKNKKLMANENEYNFNEFYIKPMLAHLKFDEKEYEGSLIISKHDKKIYVINSLHLEDYVCSVLKTEGWPGWPLEINKVLAIASRTYVIGVILHGLSSSMPYHVKNTNKHQTYTGVHTNPILKKAVEETEGIFLSYNDKPIVAMFDSCCGGVIPAHIHGVNFKMAPYLERTYPCNFCKSTRAYAWNVDYSLKQFEDFIKKELKNCKAVKSIKIDKLDNAGLVESVSIYDKKLGKMQISGKKIYSLFSKVKSFCFDITCAKDRIYFSGRGVGHHLGLCQWGALEMIKQGYDIGKIFDFYFPGTKLMRLQV